MDYRLHRKFITAAEIITGQVTGASTVLTMGLGSGAGNLVELGTSGIGAIKLAATTDEIDFLWVPCNVDYSNRILIRHLWTSDYATANGTATFTTKYNALKSGVAAVIGATALDKTITASTKVSATARTVYYSPYGWIAPSVLTPDTMALTIDTVCSAVAGITIASDFVYWLGCEIAYTPLHTFGDGSRREARLMSYPNAFNEADPTIDI